MTWLDEVSVLATLFCSKKGLSIGRVSSLVFGDGTKLKGILDRQTDLTTKRYEKTVQWFSTNWPEGLVWPPSIRRPEGVVRRPQ